MPLPALRNLDVSTVEHEGQTLVCLRDMEGYIEDPVVLTPLAFFIASHLDGQNEVTDIQCEFARHFDGKILLSEDVRRVSDFLDGNGFLLSERFFALQQETVESFAHAERRPAFLAGKGYPNDPDELRALLDGFFESADGPGQNPAALPQDVEATTPNPVRCLVVPHIDFARGAGAYAHGYFRLRQGGRPDTILIFGVAHAAPPVPFILTRKHFETPFGVVETDQGIVDRLAAACDWDPFEAEIVHRTEHSIEFQAVLLAYLYGSAVRIVPILCAADPKTERGGAAFLEACRALVAQERGKLTVIAAADLAHVGKRFGDPFDINQGIRDEISARDHEDLAHVTALDHEGFYRSVMRDGNERRVCGVYSIYSALKASEGALTRGELLRHGYAPDPAGGIVSFAAIALE